MMGIGLCHGDPTVPQGPSRLPPVGICDSEVTPHETDGQGRRRGEGGGKLACPQGVTSVTAGRGHFFQSSLGWPRGKGLSGETEARAGATHPTALFWQHLLSTAE